MAKKLINIVDGIEVFRSAKQIEKEATSLERLFGYWKEMLLNRVIRLFEWEGLPFPQHELELNTMLLGIGAVVYDKEAGMVTRFCHPYGVTRYPDVYTNVNYAMPDKNGKSISGDAVIGDNAVVLYNTSLSMPMSPFLERYASLLTHGDLSYKAMLIARRAQETLAASNSATVESINSYYDSKYRGNPQGILDKSMADIQGGMQNLSGSVSTPDFMNVLESQNEVLRSFYRDIGIRWTKEKRGNMIVEEVDSDGQMLLFNISDMLKCREKFCEEYNKVFKGRAKDISVKISSELEPLVNTPQEREVSGNDTGTIRDTGE